MTLPNTVQGAAIVVGMMRLGALAVQTLAANAPTSTAARAATMAFQKAWNLAAPTLRGGGMTTAQTPHLTEDGLYGPNTAAALTTALTNGSTPLPRVASGIAQWWATNQAAVQQYISGTLAQAQQAVQSGTGDAAAAAQISSGADQVVQTATNASSAVLQQAAHSAVSSTDIAGQGAGTPIQGEPITITGQAPSKSNLWILVVVGLGIIAGGGAIAWAAYRKRKRARRG